MVWGWERQFLCHVTFYLPFYSRHLDNVPSDKSTFYILLTLTSRKTNSKLKSICGTVTTCTQKSSTWDWMIQGSVKLKEFYSFIHVIFCTLPLSKDYIVLHTYVNIIYSHIPKRITHSILIILLQNPSFISMEICRTRDMNKATGKTIFSFWVYLKYFLPPILQILGAAKLMCHQCWSVSRGHGHDMSHDDTLMVTISPAWAGDYNSLSLR